jgi:hypothetical protein
MTYHPVPLGIDQGKMTDLAHGRSVKIAHSDMCDGETFHLTKSQIAKLTAAYNKGKGCNLKLSSAQLRHHMSGSGFFSDLVNKAKAVANSDIGKFAINAATPYAKEYGMKALNVGKDYALKKINGGNWFDDVMGPVAQIAHVAAPFAQMAMQQRGGNWFDDVIGPVAQIAQVAAPFVGMALKSGAGVAPHQVKGSAAAKERMAKLRAMKKKGSGLYQN